MGVMVNSCKPSAGEEGTGVPGAHWPPAQPGHPKLVRDTVSINKVGGVWGPPPEVVLRPCIHVHTFVPALGSTPKITSKENCLSSQFTPQASLTITVSILNMDTEHCHPRRKFWSRGAGSVSCACMP